MIETLLEQQPHFKEKSHLTEMHPERFDNIAGCFEDFEYHIVTDPPIKPGIHASKKISFELK